jgi:hypothetical protein
MPPRLSTILRWPLWIAQLFTGAQSFADNPIIGSRRLNSLGLHRLRLRGAHALTSWRRWLLSGGVSVEDRAAFARQGYVEWRDVLPPDAFDRMRRALFDRAWPAREMAQGHAVTRRIAVDRTMLRAIPELAQLLRSSRWRGLMRYVASSRSEPLYYIQTILTHRAGPDADPQNTLHADAFHPSMKAWLFLTDVAPEDGPLNYVAGAHRLTAQRLAWDHAKALQAPAHVDRLSARGSLRIGKEELAQLGLPEPTAFAVPANTLIVADMFGFHARGPAARPSVRVEIWAYARRNPFLPWTGLDIASLPGIAERRVALLWRFKDRFERWTGQPWKDVGRKRPDAL